MTQNQEKVFTFRPIDYAELKEYRDKEWKIKEGDDWKTRSEKSHKYIDDKNSRYYRIFKIKPVKKMIKISFSWSFLVLYEVVYKIII